MSFHRVLSPVLWTAFGAFLGYPILVLLGQMMVIRDEVAVSQDMIQRKSDHVFRVGQFGEPFREREVQRIRFFGNGQEYRRVAFSWQLDEPGLEGRFWAKEKSLHISPPSENSEFRIRRAESDIVRPWRPPLAGNVTWAATGFALGLAWFLVPSLRSRWHSVVQNFRRFFDPAEKWGPGWVRHLCLLTAAAFVVILRFGVKLRDPFFIAEDGVVFFEEDRVLGGAALFQPYAGYLHLVPRLVAFLAGHIDPAMIPGWYVGISFAILLAILWGIWMALDRGVLGWAACFFLLLFPDNFYLFLTPTNLQWFLGLLLFFLAWGTYSNPPRRWQKSALLLVTGLIGLTGPFTILLVPAFAIRYGIRRDAWSAQLLVVQMGTAMVQGLNLIRDSESGAADTQLGEVGLSGALGVMSKMFIPPGIEERLGDAIWIPGAILAGLWVVAAILALRSLPEWPERFRMLSWMGTAFLFLAAAFVRCGTHLDLWGMADRYFVVPLVILMTGFATLAGAKVRFVRGLARVSVAMGLLTIASVKPSYLTHSGWKAHLDSIPPGGEALIEIAPSEGWSVYMARDLESGQFLSGERYQERAIQFRKKILAEDQSDSP